MGTGQSTEAGDGGEDEKVMAASPSAEGLETMQDAPEVLRFSESGGGAGGGAGGAGYAAAQQIDVAAPMDIAGTPRGGAAEQRMDNSMPDSSFASSFGSFMSPPEGGAGASATPATAHPRCSQRVSRCC
jgi:hypothetical protein